MNLLTGPTLYLPVGPQGAGKSTFSLLVVQKYPNTTYISRDEICTEYFGQNSPPNQLAHNRVLTMVIQRILQAIREDANAQIILDYWTFDNEERSKLVHAFRDGCGIRTVFGWNFTTSKKIAIAQLFYRSRDSVGKMMLKIPLLNRLAIKILHLIEGPEIGEHYDEFVGLPETLDGFDRIININPHNPPAMESVLNA